MQSVIEMGSHTHMMRPHINVGHPCHKFADTAAGWCSTCHWLCCTAACRLICRWVPSRRWSSALKQVMDWQAVMVAMAAAALVPLAPAPACPPHARAHAPQEMPGWLQVRVRVVQPARGGR